MDSPVPTATEPDFPELVGPPCHACGHAAALTGCSAHAFLLICPACGHRTSDTRRTVPLCLLPIESAQQHTGPRSPRTN